MDDVVRVLYPKVKALSFYDYFALLNFILSST
jgi:hypothetical protein